MKYKRAEEILPKYLIEELQKYASGDLVYIPKPKDKHLGWGELTNSKKYIITRNTLIREKYRNGNCPDSLSKEFCLSIHSIKKIIYAK